MNKTDTEDDYPPFPFHSKDLKYIEEDGVWTDKIHVWDDECEYITTWEAYCEIVQDQEWDDESEMMYDVIGKTQEYRAASAPWEDPACWFAMSRELSKLETVPKRYKLLVKGAEKDAVSVTIMHREIGPQWSKTEIISFPSSATELSDVILALQDDMNTLEMLTHGCPMCWRYCTFGKVQEIASEYSVDEEYVNDIMEAIKNRELSLQFHGPIEPHCPACDGHGGVPKVD